MPVRPIAEDEIPILVEELWRPFAEEMAALDPYNELAEGISDTALAYRREQFEDPDVATFVAERDGALVGYTAVQFSESPPVFTRGPEATISGVYVRPDYRGEGIATALLDRAETWASDRGCEYVTLSVNADNASAKGLYESRGYGVRRHKMDRALDSRDPD